MGKRAKSKKRSNTRRGGPRRGPTAGLPSPTHLLDELIRSAREIVSIEDPLDAEGWGSGLIGMWADLFLIGEEDPVRFFGERVVRRAAATKKREGLALLLSLAAVGPPWLAGRASAAAARLREAGVPPPPWAAQVGRATFVEGWRITHPYGDQDAIWVSFRHDDRPPHAFSVLIDHNLGGIVKDAFAGYPEEDLVEAWREQPDFEVARIEAAEVAGRVLPAIEREGMYLDPPTSESYEETRALLAARMRTLPRGWEEQGPPPLSGRQRAALVAEFARSPEARGVAEADDVAETMVDYSCDYGTGEPLRWSPIVVELFLCDWYPRKVIREEAVLEQVPDVVRAWVRFAARKRGLPIHLVGETLEAVEDFEEEFREAAADPTLFGPAKSVLMAMQADGVDPTDEAAVQTWIAEFNSRPEEDRRLVLP